MYPRKIYQKLKDHLEKKEITVLTGMRRTGKTTLVKSLLAEIDSKNKIYLDLQVLVNQDIFSPRNFDEIIDTLTKKGLDFSKKPYVALDEIQLVKEITGVLKYLHDNYDIKFIITGSSSYYLKNHFTESLAGRKKIFELFPLDFSEFLVFKGVLKDIPKIDFKFKNIKEVEYNLYTGHYNEFVEFGGFPQVVLAKTAEEKKGFLEEIISSYINVDVSSLVDFADRQNVYNLIKLLASRAGNKLDYSKLSRLSGLSRPTVKNYINLFEGTYLISKIPVLTNNIDREIVKAEKIYFCDSGLLGILADVGSGAKFENAIYSQIRQLGEVRYFSLKSGREIDFILENLNGESISLEVKETPTEVDKNSLAGLSEQAGVARFHLVGKNKAINFSDYIWGGSI
jgi:predicted AAA+ superfamily ATPase